MSEQIREQVSAFLDGELPDSEAELLLKRLARDGQLRESFGRYALIGEALRGPSLSPVTKGFASRVQLAVGGVSHAGGGHRVEARTARWWRPFAGAAVAAGVAAVAVVAFQQRADAPGVRVAAVPSPREAISYTVPAAPGGAGAGMPAARLTNYVFAHSRYASGLDQRGVLADLLIEADEQQPAVGEAAAHVAP